MSNESKLMFKDSDAILALVCKGLVGNLDVVGKGAGAGILREEGGLEGVSKGVETYEFL